MIPGALCAAFVALHFYLLSRAEFLVADAIERWGRNVDSGQHEVFIAWTYALPSAAMFAVAAIASLFGPIWGRRGLILAWTFVVGAPALLLVTLLIAPLFW